MNTQVLKRDGSTLALSAFAGVLLLLPSVFFTPWLSGWQGIVIGLCLMGAAVPAHILARSRGKWYYIASMLLNTVGAGFSIAAHFAHFNTAPQIAAYPVALALFFTASFIGCALLSQGGKAITIAVSILYAGLLGVSFTRGVLQSDGLYTLLFYMALWLGFYYVVYALSKNENCTHLRRASRGCFGGFLIVTIVSLILITEGEILDFGDIGDIPLPNRNKTGRVR